MRQSLTLHGNVVPLDTFDLVPVIPSDTIYYNHYAYKLVLDVSSYIDPDYFIEEFEDFTKDTLQESVRLVNGRKNENEIYCYLKSIDDCTITATVYAKLSKRIYGPVSKEHLNVLTSRHYRCIARKSLWYKKYDGKIYMFLPYSKIFGASQGERREMQAEIIRAVTDGLPEGSYKFYPYMQSGSSVEFYTNLEEFNNFYPFLKMQYNNWTVITTKCFLY